MKENILGQINFKLSDDILYQHPAGESKTNKILLKCFSRNHRYRHENNLIIMRKMLEDAYTVFLNKIGKLRNLFAGDNSVENPKDNKVEDKGLDINSNLLISSIPRDDFIEYSSMFWELMYDDLCLIDGKVSITSDLKNDISIDDQSRILCKYTENFIMPSWIKQQFQN